MTFSRDVTVPEGFHWTFGAVRPGLPWTYFFFSGWGFEAGGFGVMGVGWFEGSGGESVGACVVEVEEESFFGFLVLLRGFFFGFGLWCLMARRTRQLSNKMRISVFLSAAKKNKTTYLPGCVMHCLLLQPKMYNTRSCCCLSGICARSCAIRKRGAEHDPHVAYSDGGGVAGSNQTYNKDMEW